MGCANSKAGGAATGAYEAPGEGEANKVAEGEAQDGAVAANGSAVACGNGVEAYANVIKELGSNGLTLRKTSHEETEGKEACNGGDSSEKNVENEEAPSSGEKSEQNGGSEDDAGQATQDGDATGEENNESDKAEEEEAGKEEENNTAEATDCENAESREKNEEEMAE